MKIICLNDKCPNCKECALFIAYNAPKFPVRYVTHRLDNNGSCSYFIKVWSKK